MEFRLALVLALLSSAAYAATAPPKVVFIGDYFTYNWTSGFAANPNWVNKGVDGSYYIGQRSGDLLARFQADVVSLHPAIVHILVGAIDAQISSAALTEDTPPVFAANLDAMVKAAEAANIKVILGITPGTAGGSDHGLPQINSIVAAYGAASNIQVVNYGDALCECVGALGQPTETSNTFQQLVYTVPGLPSTSPGPYVPTLLPTNAGYMLMTQLAETAVANEYLTQETGWLSNVAMQNPYVGVPTTASNVNTVEPGVIVQFTPIGYYSNGSQHPQTNTTWEGATGTWTSSNPLVMSVNQQGLALATTPGTTTIHYAPANGVKFSSWVMHVQH